MSNPRLAVRLATDADMPAITAIYAHHVATGTASFELTPPDVAEMRRRRDEIAARGLPYLVASAQDAPSTVAGYAYASMYRARAAYRHTLEDSVYVDAAYSGRGVGRALLTALVASCERLGYRQMLAVIGGSDNAASIGLHAALGFEHVGNLVAVGRKFDCWLDTTLMQRPLGEGATAPPSPPSSPSSPSVQR